MSPVRALLPLLGLLAVGVGCAERGTPKPPAPTAEDARTGNVVRFTTAREKDVVGFHVYRSSRADGPYERVTPEPIPGAGRSETSRDYAWVDRTIQPGTAYYYYVESVDRSGRQTRVTTVLRSKPKGAPAPPPAAATRP